MAHTRPGTWTAERVTLFNEIHEQVPKAIWVALNALPGPPVTKSAVTGRRDRHRGMVRRPKRTEEEKAAALVARREREAVKKRAQRAEKIAAGDTMRRSTPFRLRVLLEQPDMQRAEDVTDRNVHGIAALEVWHCRYPLNDDMSSPVFCGSYKLDGHSYCPHHCRVSYKAPEVRRAAA